MPRLAERVFPSFPSWHTLEADISRAGLVKTNTEGTLCFHSFRKMLATELERAGVGLKTAAAVTRHHDAGTLKRVYMKPPQGDAFAAVRRLPVLGIFPEMKREDGQDLKKAIPPVDKAVGNDDIVVRLGHSPLQTECVTVPGQSTSALDKQRAGTGPQRTLAVDGAGGKGDGLSGYSVGVRIPPAPFDEARTPSPPQSSDDLSRAALHLSRALELLAGRSDRGSRPSDVG